MTLVSLSSPMHWPGMGNFTNLPAPGNQTTVSASGHYQAYIFCAREDMTISHVGFRAGTATGSPTIEVRIETVDASGMPSGALWNLNGTGANPKGTTGTISSSSYVLQALTNSAVILKGEIFCVKLAYASGTSQIISQMSGIVVPFSSALPYQVANTGTPTKSAFTNASAMVAFGSSSTTFYQVPGTIPCTGQGGGQFNNTNSARRGLRFTIPFNCRAIGVRWYHDSKNGDFNAVLFSDAGSELSSSSTAFDGDQNALGNGGASTVYFDNTVSLTAGTTYRLAIEPTSATNAGVYTFTLPSADYRSATALGANGHYTTFASGSWTDTATDQVPMMDLVIDQIDDGSGSGSGVVGVIGG